MSDKTSKWLSSNCRFAQTDPAPGVSPQALSAAISTAIGNLLKSMGTNNPNIDAEIKEAQDALINPALTNMNGALTTLGQQLTEFFAQKSEDKAVAPNQSQVQQAVQNPNAAPVQ